MLTSAEHLLCVWECNISVLTDLNPYHPGRGTLSPFTHEETALVKVVTRSVPRKAGLFSTIQIGRVGWEALLGVGSGVESVPVLKSPSPCSRPCFYLRTSLLPPVGGVGSTPLKPRPFSCFGS